MAAAAKRLIPGKRVVASFSIFFWLLFAAGGLFAQTVPSPESVLGYKPGADYHLTRYTESLAYFQKLAAASDKIRLERVGKTSEGQDWYIAIISSSENLKNIERYRDIARRIALVQDLNDESARKLAREGKAIVHVDGGLHSAECAGAEHTIQLAYDLVSGANDPQIKFILDNVILVLWFSLNPDGQNMVADWYRRNLGTEFEVSPMPWLYQKYVGHDNNRDGYMNNMTESQVVTRVAVEQWFPMVYYNHHQTAPFPTRIWIPPFAEPISSNVHPLMWRWTNVFGTAMASYLDQHGMPGSVHRTGFDDWYPGFIDGVNNYRNTISFLTETALYRYATPHFYTVQDFPKEYQELRQEVFYSSPWKGGWWRLGDAVRYMVGASMSVLDTAAKYREEIIYNRYQAGTRRDQAVCQGTAVCLRRAAAAARPADRRPDGGETADQRDPHPPGGAAGYRQRPGVSGGKLGDPDGPAVCPARERADGSAEISGPEGVSGRGTRSALRRCRLDSPLPDGSGSGLRLRCSGPGLPGPAAACRQGHAACRGRGRFRERVSFSTISPTTLSGRSIASSRRAGTFRSRRRN